MSLPPPLERLPQPTPTPEQLASEAHLTPCFCGLWRALPRNITVGDVCQLVPCPRCGAAPRLRYVGAMVELVDPTTPCTIGVHLVEGSADASA